MIFVFKIENHNDITKSMISVNWLVINIYKTYRILCIFMIL